MPLPLAEAAALCGISSIIGDAVAKGLFDRFPIFGLNEGRFF
jgi:hypothetical protein